MFNKKFLTLFTGYILWWVVASIYNKKKPWDLQKKIKDWKNNWEWEFNILLNDFIETHKNLLDSFKKESIYIDNKNKIEAKTKELLEILDSYKNDWKKLLEELKVKWKDYVSQTLEKLEKLYSEKKEEIEWIKDVAPEKIKDLKDKLFVAYEDIKKKIEIKK